MEQPAFDQQLMLLQTVAETVLGLYDLPPKSTAALINLSENATFRVDDPSMCRRWALRVHREGYHSKNAIASELAWLMALRDEGDVITPKPVKGTNGELVQIHIRRWRGRVTSCCSTGRPA